MKLHFSIRDIFLVVLVAALTVGWWLDHRVMSAKADKAFQALKDRPYMVHRVIASNQDLAKQLQLACNSLMLLRYYDPRLVEAATKPEFDINTPSQLPDYQEFSVSH